MFEIYLKSYTTDLLKIFFTVFHLQDNMQYVWSWWENKTPQVDMMWDSFQEILIDMINLAAVQIVKAYKKWKNLAQKPHKKVLKFTQCLEKTEKLVGITFVKLQHILHFLTNLWPELL